MLTALILLATAATGALLIWPRLARARMWRASLTPLASIIGSGFLVLGPILDASYGAWAPLIMAALCLAAYGFGGAIRFNIARRAAPGTRRQSEEAMETAASWVLAFAYFISVAYYLNLFGAFGTRLTPWNDTVHARLLTSAMLGLILLIGWTRGFAALERLEQVTVGIKLAIIAGLLAGLSWFLAQKAGSGELLLNPATETGWSGLALAFGLIVTVQGFETSRYLGEEYDARIRIRSMRLAQGVSTAIYMVYVCLIAYVFAPGEVGLSETSIIGLMDIVAPILPLMLTAAALAAQFSAAIADTGGSGGLIAELTRGKVPLRLSYALLVGISLALTWGFNVFQIITHASRAFALYYAVQSAIACRGAWTEERRALAAGFAALALLGLVIALFGTPVE